MLSDLPSSRPPWIETGGTPPGAACLNTRGPRHGTSERDGDGDAVPFGSAASPPGPGDDAPADGEAGPDGAGPVVAGPVVPGPVVAGGFAGAVALGDGVGAGVGDADSSPPTPSRCPT